MSAGCGTAQGKAKQSLPRCAESRCCACTSHAACDAAWYIACRTLRGAWLRAASRHGAALSVHRRTRRALGAQRRKHHHAGFVRYNPNLTPQRPPSVAVQRRLHGCTAAALGSKALPVPMPRCAARLYVALNVRVVAWHVTRRVARCVLCATLGEAGDYFYLLESGTADCFVCAVRCRAQSHPLI